MSIHYKTCNILVSIASTLNSSFPPSSCKSFLKETLSYIIQNHQLVYRFRLVVRYLTPNQHLPLQFISFIFFTIRCLKLYIKLLRNTKKKTHSEKIQLIEKAVPVKYFAPFF